MESSSEPAPLDIPAPPPGYPQSPSTPDPTGSGAGPIADHPEQPNASNSRTSLIIAFSIALFASAGILAWLVVNQVAPKSPESVVAPAPENGEDRESPARIDEDNSTEDGPAAIDNEKAQTTSTVVVEATTSTTEPTTTTTLAIPIGDLGLPTIMSSPACDGRWITIVGSAVDAASYAEAIAGFLRSNPGAAYLRTSTTNCNSLRRYFDDGSEIYAAFYGPFEDPGDACDLVKSLGGGAYAKPLDNISDPSFYLTSVDC